jgi:hypothetical protein
MKTLSKRDLASLKKHGIIGREANYDSRYDPSRTRVDALG